MTVTELAERVEQAVLEAQGAQVIAFRALANESNISRARAALSDATDVVEAKQADKRDAAERLAITRDEHAAAVVDAEYDLGGHWAVRSNKQWLVRDAAGKTIDEDTQRSFTADERAKWITTEAAKRPDVARLAQGVRKAELAKEQADDELRLAERRWTAARVELEAASSWLLALSNSLRGEHGNGH